MSAWYRPDCRHFLGHRPCRFGRGCEGCPHHAVASHRILLVQLGALGDVVRSTALLRPIRRRWPDAHLTWLTSSRAVPLLDENPLVDRVLAVGEGTAARLQVERFDLVLCPDQDPSAAAMATLAAGSEHRGFELSPQGAVVPCSAAAEHLLRLSLDDPYKLLESDLPLHAARAEALGLPPDSEPYVLPLRDEERAWALQDRGAARGGTERVVVGWNTGCSPGWSYKRLTIADQARWIEAAWARLRDVAAFVLLGGPEDRERNGAIAERLADRVPLHLTPTDGGLRRGIAAVAACDVVVSGDSLGLHLALALERPVVAWFTVTPHAEVDVFGRGVKVLADVPCRPCFRRSCERPARCFERLPWQEATDALVRLVAAVGAGEEPSESTVGPVPARSGLTLAPPG